jgi:hypothetical protein
MGKKPTPPTTYIPTPAAPVLYKSVIPEADFARAADYLAQIRADRRDAEAQRYQQVGTPEEIGRRQGEIRAKEAAAYNASLPKGSQYDALRALTDRPAQIENLYKDILGRSSDPGGLQYYVNTGKSIESIRGDLEQSPEHRKQQQAAGVQFADTAPLPAIKQSQADSTPSWAIPTATEKAAQEARDEEARIYRILKAKDLAKKVAEADKSATETNAEPTPTLSDSALRYV